ncbi:MULTISPECIES: CDP-diacylglycerol--glycerol-3-phosphate 3-phosphatidyltransferase [Aerococcus]|uniref:CDP-diacylglycerol--glycerol-3-phosphate 3-phosphatidyltransferase n=1 Tax=Aerococcus tenax TaxID=3078812 RepID=A0A5N1BUW9_9LACT|nr:CDP-diacylglycerol--glycerol-3-phosphate 3-phosphatidyltransferase [Aerococcus urinae]KAA9242794.1 CDP-diacylglycerol--glycerol-3-phosphate 3-phosphatidyltransferase [Aerococcus urinae]MDK6370986.1 CDP-diacylglycerol--glycerol-3-phosphate 3-phosphatidyltransferase [Aerococcus urinae]MDK6598003.1 CDP-diacylglycerol--glycerol-3-phosphate 3-phosphatidyltransferase [Aerococcus urinae]MDK7301807.1 CDP-diacylglycerol--glycerol-3-phosphate 3-phosphatidyltransferase [Aerococcus urinae]MDK7801241.1 
MNLPNRLTMLRILMIPLFILLIEIPFDWGTWSIGSQSVNIQFAVAALIFAIASLTDWLDGYIARRDNLVTNFGKFADPLADKMLVITALIELIALGKAPAWLVAIIVMRELAVTGLRLLIVTEGEVLAAKWPGKIKTCTQMLAIILLLVNDFPFQAFPFSFGQFCLYLALLATIYSGYDYFKKNWQVFSDSF